MYGHVLQNELNSIVTFMTDLVVSAAVVLEGFSMDESSAAACAHETRKRVKARSMRNIFDTSRRFHLIIPVSLVGSEVKGDPLYRTVSTYQYFTTHGQESFGHRRKGSASVGPGYALTLLPD